MYHVDSNRSAWRLSLLFADDIAIIAKSEADLQQMLDAVNVWCKKWRLSINQKKSKVIHFRFKGKKQSNYKFKCGDCRTANCKV